MDGILIINKHKGCTSHDIVHKIKKITKEKVGHTGTLDPMATGVLPLLIGKGTLCSKYLIEHDKTYKATLKLGIETDTKDLEGRVIQEQAVDIKILEKSNVENILKSFVGKQEQIPPIYSAIKVDGKKLYEYAREGKEVRIQPRTIEIYDMNLEKIDRDNKEIVFKVSCSKGTYIRSLCSDVAKKLGTIGCMSDLERLSVGRFDINESITLETINNNIENINNNLITIERLFDKSKNIILEDKKLKLFLNGVQLKVKEKDGAFKIYNNNKFIGIGCIKDNILKRDIIII